MAAVETGSGVHLVNLADGTIAATLAAPSPMQFPTGIEYSPDGRFLAALVADGRLFLWDLGQLHRKLAAMGLDW